jgi:putative MFS transporter
MSTVVAGDKLPEIVSRIERLPATIWQVKARLIVGVATFFDAFDGLIIASCLSVLIPLWHMKPQQAGFLISSGFLGQMIGAIFFGWLAERYGRLRTTILTILVYSVASFLCAASWDYTSLFIFRLIQGFGLGGEVPVAASYINEITKAKGRGKFVLLYEILFPLGLLGAALAGWWIVPRFGWRWLFIIGGLPSLLAIYLRWPLPESPRWLASVGRNEDAEKAMTKMETKIRKSYGADLPEPKPVPLSALARKRSRVAELFQGIYLKRTLLVWVIWFSVYLPVFGTMTWLPSIYRTVFKMPLYKALLYAVALNVAGIFGTFTAAMLIDKVGRRVWITLAFLCGGSILVGLWLAGAKTALQLLAYSTAAHFFFSSVSISVYLYTPELYPTRLRALGSSVSSAWLRVASMIGPIVVGTVIAHYSLAWAFLLFGLVALAGGIVTGFFGIETKGKVLEEISP